MAQSIALQPLRPSELAVVTPPALNWLWHGYLAPGKITALISPPKTGKTTLAANLLAHLALGGHLAGLVVVPARALVRHARFRPCPQGWIRTVLVLLGDNMFDVERKEIVVLLVQLAILAAPAGPFANEGS